MFKFPTNRRKTSQEIKLGKLQKLEKFFWEVRIYGLGLIFFVFGNLLHSIFKDTKDA